MKCLTQIVFLFLIATAWSQKQEDETEKDLKIIADINVTGTSNLFFGNNYLAKGHKNPSLGVNISLYVFQYKNIKFGGTLEKSSINVSDITIGGNIKKSNINSAYISVLNDIKISKRFVLSPDLTAGFLQIRQKNGAKFYGSQYGYRIGLGVDLNYKLSNDVVIFSNVGYNRYILDVQTSDEYKKYFNNSNSVNFNFGFKFITL
jgi:hypothetical protein